MRQPHRSGEVQGQCCLAAVLLPLGLALVRVVPRPVDPVDALLVRCPAVTLVLRLVRCETGREVGATRGARVHLAVGRHRYAVPLALPSRSGPRSRAAARTAG